MRSITLTFSFLFCLFLSYDLFAQNPISTREMDRINWMEFAEFVPEKITTVLLPTGTLEPHGVINNGADDVAPFAMAMDIAEDLNALVAPTLNYGITGSMAAYPNFDQTQADEYFKKVNAKVAGLIKETIRKWDLAGL